MARFNCRRLNREIRGIRGSEFKLQLASHVKLRLKEQAEA
jgi:hypothetical protein